jgi:hypothetical protein
MRAGIGILSVLITVAIILFVSFSGPGGGYVTTVVSKGQNAQSQAQQLSGRDDNGMTAEQSIMLEENAAGGRLHGLVVKAIMPMGPMATTYGLVKGDEITEVGPMRVRDENNGDLMKSLTYEAYQRNWPLVIIRNGQELKLSPNSPLTSAHPNLFAAPGTTPTGNNSPPLPQQQQQQQQVSAPTVQQQLPQKIPTH